MNIYTLAASNVPALHNFPYQKVSPQPSLTPWKSWLLYAGSCYSEATGNLVSLAWASDICSQELCTSSYQSCIQSLHQLPGNECKRKSCIKEVRIVMAIIHLVSRSILRRQCRVKESSSSFISTNRQSTTEPTLMAEMLVSSEIEIDYR